MKHRRIALVALVLIIATVSGGWLFQRSDGPSRSVYDKARLFEDILAYIAEYYVDSVSVTDLYDMAIEGMLDKLNDPYTNYLRREVYEDLTLNTTGNYGGVGIRIDSRDNWITIVTALPDTPGERAGLEPGDQIVAIDSASTEGWTTQQAADVMRGKPGTTVELTVARAGVADVLRFEIVRARIHVNSIEGPKLLSPEVGYVRMANVSESSASELEAAVNQLRAEGARSLIMDLRNNPGGILEQGVAIADLFLDRGNVVVEMKGQAPRASSTFRAQRRQTWPDMPVVVLVNAYTASAAEIISGALQDHDRALVLGTPTFGKGVAYIVFRLSETEAVSVTTSRWFTPVGRSINRPRLQEGQPVRASLLRAGATDSAQVPDSARAYYSRAGRSLKGGGGIRPDIELRPDSLTESEQAFATALGGNVPKYRDAMARYALDLKGAGTIIDEDFVISDAMLAELLTRLRTRGVELPDSVWSGAKGLVSEQFGYEVSRYVFGREAELRRRAQNDNQIRRAMELLQKAESPTDLLELAQRQ